MQRLLDRARLLGADVPAEDMVGAHFKANISVIPTTPSGDGRLLGNGLYAWGVMCEVLLTHTRLVIVGRDRAQSFAIGGQGVGRIDSLSGKEFRVSFVQPDCIYWLHADRDVAYFRQVFATIRDLQQAIEDGGRS